MVTSNEKEFDMVFDCQKVFKEVMNALARPGKVFSVNEASAKLEGEHKTLTAIAFTFLDNRCKYFTCGEQEWSETIKERTLSAAVEPEEADFLLITSAGAEATECSEWVSKAKSGSLPEPHKSALFLIELESLTQGEALCLKGPGIQKERNITIPAAGKRWLEEREKQEYEYPCGIDFIFCTPDGELMGIPRTTKVGGEQ